MKPLSPRFALAVIALAAVAAFFCFSPRVTLPVVLAMALPALKESGAILDPRQGESRAIKLEARLRDPGEAGREQRKKVAALTDAEKLQLKYSWEFWARPNQLLPPATVDWQTWLIMAGRGFGKTRTGAEAVRVWARGGKFKLINIIAPTSDDARDVCVEGESGILAICPRVERPEYHRSLRKLTWPNGATSLIFTADEPERLRGKQHEKLWCDELAAWRYLGDAWDQAMLGLRLGDNPQCVVTTTPKPLKEVKALSAEATTYLTRGTTYENRQNLAKAFYSRIIVKYEGTRLGRQELNAELLEDRPGALWTLRLIDDARIKSPEKFWQEIFPKLIRVVGAIDPAVTSNEDSDETGIIFVGVDGQSPPHFYPFDDRSNIYTPDGWGKAAVAGYHQHQCDRLVGETNNGGEMVEATLRHVDPNVSYIGVHASRGKITRAEPISALYEQGRVHHVGTLGTLEDQMCDYDPVTATFSPDRMDALVWAMTELSESSNELAVIEALKAGKNTAALVERPPVVTVKAAAPVGEKPTGCPACGSTLVSTVAGGQRRCAQCAHQWGEVVRPNTGFNRVNVGRGR